MRQTPTRSRSRRSRAAIVPSACSSRTPRDGSTPARAPVHSAEADRDRGHEDEYPEHHAQDEDDGRGPQEHRRVALALDLEKVRGGDHRAHGPRTSGKAGEVDGRIGRHPHRPGQHRAARMDPDEGLPATSDRPRASSIATTRRRGGSGGSRGGHRPASRARSPLGSSATSGRLSRTPRSATGCGRSLQGVRPSWTFAAPSWRSRPAARPSRPRCTERHPRNAVASTSTSMRGSISAETSTIAVVGQISPKTCE